MSTRRLLSAALVMVVLTLVEVTSLPTKDAEAQASYTRISGEGSSWAAGFMDAMRVNVKQFGITAQREVEKAVRDALERGTLRGNEVLDARTTMTVQGLGAPIEVTGRIELG